MFSTFFMMRGICDANRSHRENFKNCDFFIPNIEYVSTNRLNSMPIPEDFRQFLPVTDIYLKHMTFGTRYIIIGS